MGSPKGGPATVATMKSVMEAKVRDLQNRLDYLRAQLASELTCKVLLMSRVVSWLISCDSRNRRSLAEILQPRRRSLRVRSVSGRCRWRPLPNPSVAS